ncbi:C-type lectin domain family 4 member C-like [Mustelus asterias]
MRDSESERQREREIQIKNRERNSNYINMRNIKNNTAPRADEFGQETAGGRCSITSTHLGLIALIVLIVTLAIAIGLRVQGLQLNQEHLRHFTELDGKSHNLSSIRERMREDEGALCALLRKHTEFHCPSGWKLHNQNCYRFSIAKGDWDTAKRECESQNSHLIIINSQQEESFVIQSIPDRDASYLIGLTDRESEGNWEWVDGTPVSSPRWIQNEPDNWNNDEDCGVFRKHPRDNKFGWNDVPCSLELSFICEKGAPTCIEAAELAKYCP